MRPRVYVREPYVGDGRVAIVKGIGNLCNPMLQYSVPKMVFPQLMAPYQRLMRFLAKSS